jgi:hypothetical protein
MDPWGHSSFSEKIVLGLIEDGLLRPVTNVMRPEWIVPSNEDEPNPPSGYVISFAHFHEWGFRTPASNFFCGLLHHYEIEMQNLNPNLVLHIAIFIALCEGYLGIRPTFALWKYYLCATVFLKMVRRRKTVPVRIGSYVIQLRQSRAN